MTKTKEITIPLIKQKCLEPSLEEQKIAQVGFKEAAKILYQTQNNFWNRVLEFWPNAKGITHPDKGKWTVTIEE